MKSDFRRKILVGAAKPEIFGDIKRLLGNHYNTSFSADSGSLSEKLASSNQKLKTDLILMDKPFEQSLDQETRDSIQKQGIPVILMLPDDPKRHRDQLTGLDFFDYISLNSPEEAILATIQRAIDFSDKINEIVRDQIKVYVDKEKAFLNAIFNSIQDGISVSDKELTIISVNQTMNEWYSDKVPLKGRKCYEAYQNRTSRCKHCPSVRALKSGKLEKEEVAVTFPTNEKGVLELYAFPLRENGNEVSGVVEFVRNITESRKMLEQLKESENQNRALLQAYPDLMFVFDKEGRFIDYYSDSPEKLLLPSDDFLGKSVLKILPRDLAELTMEKLNLVFWTRKTETYEYQMEISGDIHFYESRLVPFGKDKALSIVREITERKIVEKQLQESEERATRQKAGLVKLVMGDLVFSLDVKKSFNEVTQILAETLEADMASIWMLSDDDSELRCLSHYIAKEKSHYLREALMADKFPDYFASLRQDSLIISENVREDPRLKGMTKEYLIPLGITSLLDVGIVIDGKINGVLCIEHTGHPRKWYSEEISFASTAAAILAQVFINQRRREAEKNLLDTKIELERYFSSSLDLLCIANTSGTFIRVNPEWERVLGYSVNELQGKSCLDLVHPEDYEKTWRALDKLGSNKKLLNFVNRYRSKNGDYRWIEWRAKPQDDHIYAAARDITEKINAENSLRSQLEVEKIISEISTTFITVPASGIDECINQALGLIGKHFKVDSSFIMQLSEDERFFNLTYEWCNKGVKQEIANPMLQNIPISSLNYLHKRISLLAPVFIGNTGDLPSEAENEKTLLSKLSIKSILVIPMISSDKVQGFLGLRFGRPQNPWSQEKISQIKIATEIITGAITKQRIQQEHLELQESLHQAQKMESIGRLAGGIAHDFNNMLAVILGHTELMIEKTSDGEPFHQELKEIRRAAENSAYLTRQLLAFARKQTIKPEVIDTNSTVEACVRTLQPLLGENIDLRWMPGYKVWPVLLDKSQMNHIITNLCTNARESIADKGEIIIETGNLTEYDAITSCKQSPVSDDYVFIRVSDNGRGINDKDMDKLFEPFFTTKEACDNGGLGLATVYGIVKQNLGSIDVKSELGKGSVFTLYFPRSKNKECHIKQESTLLIPDTAETILLVEDEVAAIEMLEQMLEHFGYKVLSASDPLKALELAKKHSSEIDMLFTDVVMPKMNGLELAKKVTSINNDIKILFMSGYTANIICNHGVIDKEYEFIAKPFSMQNLKCKIRDVLDS